MTSGKSVFKITVDNGDPINAVRITGAAPGKTLVVTAGVHGDEYVAIQALKELIDEIQPNDISGQVILVPVVNRSGFYAGTYLVPQDGGNLNRCFPGKKSGSLSWRIAYALERKLYAGADFLLDLHGGSPYETMTPLVFFPVAAGKEIENAVRSVAENLSLSYMVQSFAKDGLYSWAAQRKIPAALIERGGGGMWSEAEVDACKRNVFEVMNSLGICRFDVSNDKPTEICDAHYETAKSKGYWYCIKKAGEAFISGELLGKVEDEDVIQEIYAPFDGIVLYHTNSLGVDTGFPLISYGRVCK